MKIEGLRLNNLKGLSYVGSHQTFLNKSYIGEGDNQQGADVNKTKQGNNLSFKINHPLFSVICRFVESIGNSYGMALLLHMLTSTVILTLLAFEATKVKNQML